MGINKEIKIGDSISVSDMGLMGLETYTGEVVGTTNKKLIVDFGATIVEQRFQIIDRGRDFKIK